jgi:hypothetical protein
MSLLIFDQQEHEVVIFTDTLVSTSDRRLSDTHTSCGPTPSSEWSSR